MKQEIKELQINGVTYVPKEFAQENKMAEKVNGMPYVIIRTYSAGVHMGYLKSRNGKEVELLNARRIWYWEGAATLSQMAMEGVSKPDKCKFSMEVDSIELMEAIEVIPVSAKAIINLQKVATWKS